MSELAAVLPEVSRVPRSRDVTRQLWAERIARFHGSGLRPAEFCAQEGVSVPSFYSWKRRLAAQELGPADPQTPDPDPGPRLLPVRLHDPAAPIELTLPSGAVLRIRAGADEATLARLLRLLGVPPC